MLGEYYPDLQGLKSSGTVLIKVAKLGKCCYDQILKDEKKLQYLCDWFKDNRGSLKATCHAHCLNPRQNYFTTSAWSGTWWWEKTARTHVFKQMD